MSDQPLREWQAGYYDGHACSFGKGDWQQGVDETDFKGVGCAVGVGMEAKTEYTRPIAWDLKKGKELIRTVRFDSRFIEVSGRRYKVCGSNSDDVGGSFLLASIETGEFRWVNGKVIRGWLDKEAV